MTAIIAEAIKFIKYTKGLQSLVLHTHTHTHAHLCINLGGFKVVKKSTKKRSKERKRRGERQWQLVLANKALLQ